MAVSRAVVNLVALFSSPSELVNNSDCDCDRFQPQRERERGLAIGRASVSKAASPPAPSPPLRVDLSAVGVGSGEAEAPLGPFVYWGIVSFRKSAFSCWPSCVCLSFLEAHIR